MRYGTREHDVAKAHAQFLALGLHCECGEAKRKDEACCRGCVGIHEARGAEGCFDCRAGRERHLAYLADQVAQRAAAAAPPAASVIAALDAAQLRPAPICRHPVSTYDADTSTCGDCGQRLCIYADDGEMCARPATHGSLCRQHRAEEERAAPVLHLTPFQADYVARLRRGW